MNIAGCGWIRLFIVAAVTLDVSAFSASAQLQTGNLYGRVTDPAGAALPGVTVTLDTGAARQVQVTSAHGEFRFLALSPATYRVSAALAGFSTVEVDRVAVSIGHNTQLELVLSPAIKEEVTVTTEGPLLDPKVIRAGATFSQTELQEIPTTRDPWALLQSTPGVLLESLNVGGSESGRQPKYVGPGSLGSQSVWAVDGVVITDLAATGSSPAYYDFDSLEEMQVTTGGSDASIATGGVVINLVTKRGTSQLRGSARLYYSGSGWSSPSSFSNKDLPPGQPPIMRLNKIDKYEDYGVEAGGPLWKDHLWFWGAYAGSDIATTMEGGGSFSASIPVWNAKLNGQITASNSGTLFTMDSDKQRKGVNAGPTRPQPTTWDQAVFGGSPTIFKAEDTQIVGSSFYFTVLYSHVYGGLALLPESGIGPDVPAAFEDAKGKWHNTFTFDEIKRPQSHERADLSNFFDTGKVSHELMYGAGYRIAQTFTGYDWPGGGWIAAPNVGGLPVPAGLNDLFVSRPALAGITTKSASAYAEDTLNVGRLTANLGLRYEVETGRNQAASAPANPQLPELLAAVSYPGGPVGFSWKTLTPRLGLTWQIGQHHQTLLRANYSRYADQLSQDPNHAGLLNPLNFAGYYYAATTNQGDGRLTPDQVIPLGYGYTGNVNPLTGGLLQSNIISRQLAAPLTDEVLLSVQHSLLPELVAGLDLRYRVQSRLLQQDQLVYDNPNPFDPSTFDSLGRVATRADYVPVTMQVLTPNGVRTVTYYTLAPTVSTHRGYYLHNGNYQTTYKGASLTLFKRLAHRFMLHGSITYGDWYYSRAGDRPDPTILVGGGLSDGLFVAPGSPVVESTQMGPKRGIFIDSKWSFAVSGMVQVAPDRPWGFNVAANLTGRQGYPYPYFVSVFNLNGAGSEMVQVGSTDANRLGSVFELDGRVGKIFTYQRFGLILDVDCFNLLNRSTVLQRHNQLSGPNVPLSDSGAGFVEEIQSPRIFRLGVRFVFK
jgi:hypothetical protein